jgi:hypothetical protein
MNPSPQISGCPKTVFFAWAIRNGSVQDTLTKIGKQNPTRFKTLMTAPRGGDVTHSVFQGIAQAEGFVGILGEEPNVNVCFELGLALGLGKKVIAACWAAESPHKWTTKVSPLTNFITPCVKTADALRDLVDRPDVWQPEPGQFAGQLAAEVPVGGETYYLCPGGTQWDAAREELTERQDRFVAPPRDRYSVKELLSAFPRIGRLVWVMFPQSDTETQVNTPANAGNAVVAGWFLGRYLRPSQSEWAEDWHQLTEKLKVAQSSAFHPVVVRSEQVPADLRNCCESVSTAEEFGKYLDRISPPQPNAASCPVPVPRAQTQESATFAWQRAPSVITDVKGFDARAPQAALVHLAVRAALAGSHDDADFDRIREQLSLDHWHFGQVLGLPEGPYDFPITGESLRQLCGENKLLRDPGQTSKFFFTPLSLITIDLMSQVDTSTRCGKELARLIRQHHHLATAPTHWKQAIQKPGEQLKDHHIPKSQKNRILRAIYLQATVCHDAEQNEALTLADFNNHTLWNAIIGRSQEAVPEREWSHLHYANDAMRRSFAQVFASDGQLGEPAAGQGASVSILEGGVGGCNTTHYIIKGIMEGLERRGVIPQDIQITYRGFELNVQYANAANKILQGKIPVAPGGGQALPPDDPRMEFFRNKSKQFKPLRHGEPHVIHAEMTDGIEALASKTSPGSFDAFVCSYALHHVPNGLRMIEYFFAPADPDGALPRFANSFRNAAQLRQQFMEDMLWWLDQYDTGPYGLPARQLLPLTRAFTSTLVRLAPRMRQALIKEVRSIDPHKNEPWQSKLVPELIQDRQKMMLERIWHLLRPGGLIGIADPDGYSGFNRDNVPANSEMAVAHFRTRDEMRDLLGSRGFKIVDDWNLLCTDQNGPHKKYDLDPMSVEQLEALDLTQLIDHNLGYILIARKPNC